jgi:hypothetical protein
VVVGEVAVDDVGEPSFQRSAGFLGGLRFSEFLQVIVAPGPGMADLVDRDEVNGSVELPVPSPAESVPGLVAAGGLDRGGAVEAGEVVGAGESFGVTGMADDLARNNDGDAGNRGQGGSGLGDQCGELVGEGFDAGLEGPQAADQVSGELLAGGVGGGVGSHAAQRRGGLTAGQSGLDTAWYEVPQQSMEPVQVSGVLADQIVAMVADQANHAAEVFGLDVAQPLVVLGHQRDRLGISEVGFAALARGEQPNPSRQVRWHIEDVFAVFQQPLRDARPAAPSTAHRRFGHARAKASRPARVVASTGSRQVPSTNPSGPSPTAVSVALWGSIPIVITADLSRSRIWAIRDGQPDFRTPHSEPHRGGRQQERQAIREPAREGGKEHCEPTLLTS